MSLQSRQSQFLHMLVLLILYAEQRGYQLTGGDLSAKSGHIKGSFHYKRLAIDLNLFKDNVYLRKTEAHLFLGEFWESIGGTWGGRFRNKDGNHYSLGEGR
jgi:hypothetical protein